MKKLKHHNLFLFDRQNLVLHIPNNCIHQYFAEQMINDLTRVELKRKSELEQSFI